MDHRDCVATGFPRITAAFPVVSEMDYVTGDLHPVFEIRAKSPLYREDTHLVRPGDTFSDSRGETIRDCAHTEGE